MSDNKQELRSEVIVNAENALKNIGAISDALDKVSKIDFSKMREGFKEVTEAMKATSDAAKKASDESDNTSNKRKRKHKEEAEEEKEIQDLIKKRSELIKKMRQEYSEADANRTTIDFSKEYEQLQRLTRKVADLQKQLGKFSSAQNTFKEAFSVLKELGEGNGFGKGITRLDREYKSFMHDLDAVSERMKKLRDQASNDTRIKPGWNSSNNAPTRNKALEDAEKLNKVQQREEAALQKHLSDMDKARQKEINGETEKYRKWQADDAKRQEATANRQQKELAAIQRQEEAESRAAQKHLSDLQRLAITAETLMQKINQHKGADGLIYTDKEYAADLRHLNEIARRMSMISNVDMSQHLSESVFDGVNIKGPKVDNVIPTSEVKAFNSQLSEAKEKAQNLYIELERTKTASARLNFDVAVADLRRLNSEAQKMENSLRRNKSLAGEFLDLLQIRSKWIVGGFMSNMLLSAPNQLFNEFRELEQSMAGVQQVMTAIDPVVGDVANKQEVLTQRTKNYNAEIQELVGLASKYAQSMQDVSQAAQLWGRGYGKPENADGKSETEREMNAMRTTNELVAQSAMLATVDNFSMAESVKGLESILAAYDMRARSAAEATLFAGRAVDIVTKIAHTGQISAQDLVRGIEATGKAAQQAGISLEFLSAMIETGVRNTGKSGAEIGQAIKALTVGIHSDKGVKELQKFGIEISKIGADGQRHMKPLQNVILEISSALQKGDKNAEKMLLAISGGRYQYSKISAILHDEGEMMRMWYAGINSNGFAKQQLTLQLDTINAKLKQLKANALGLLQNIMKHGGDTTLKKMLDVLNNMIVKANSLSGVFASIPGILIKILAVKFGARMISSLTTMLTKLRELKNLNKSMGATSVGAYTRTAGQLTSSVGRWGSNKLFGTNIIGDTASVTKNTKAIQDNAKATETMSKADKTASTQVNILSTKEKANATATNAGTVAEVKNTTAIKAGTVAKMADMTVETLRTAGLNIIIGLLVAYAISEWNDANATEAANKAHLEANVINEKNISDADALISSLEQEVEAREANVTYLDTAYNKYIELRQATENMTDEQKKNTQSVREMDNIEQAFTKTLGADTAEKLKDGSLTRADYDASKQNYMNNTNQMRTRLKTLMKNRSEYVDHMKTKLAEKKEALQHDLDTYGNWTRGQLDHLGKLQSAWLMLLQTVRNVLSHIESAMGGVGKRLVDLGSKMAEVPFLAALGAPIHAIGIVLSGDLKNDIDDYVENNVISGDMDDVDKQLNDNNKEESELIPQLSEDKPLYGDDGGDQGTIDDGGKDGKGKAGDKKGKGTGEDNKDKQVMNYDTAAEQAIYNVYRKSGSLRNAGLSLPLLLSLAQNLPASNKDGTFNSPDIFNNASTNEFDSAYNFYTLLNQAMASHDNILEDSLKSMYGNFSDDDWKKIFNNDKDFLKDHIDFEKNAPGKSGTFNDPTEKYSSFGGAFVDTGHADFDRMAAESAARNGVDVKLVQAVMQAESGYDASATSGAGAIGLMQLMPDTASGLGVNPYDPAQNIEGGAKYLRQMLDNFGGDVSKAIAAYNAGPQAVEDYGGIPPYAETQAYVNTVLDNMNGLQVTNSGGGGSLGDAIAQHAQEDYSEGDDWKTPYSGATDGSGWCDSWTADVYHKLGLFSDTNIVNGSYFGDAFHAIGDGYEPQAGDEVEWGGHVGIYLGNGMVRARNSRTGVRTMNMDDANSYFGDVEGYGSATEAAKAQGIDPGALVTSKGHSRWQPDDVEGLAAIQRSAVSEMQAKFDKQSEAYELEKKRIELEKKFTGDTAKTAEEELSNEQTRLDSLGKASRLWDQLYTRSKTEVDKLIEGQTGIRDLLAGSKWEDLTDDEQDKIAEAMKKALPQFPALVKALQTATKNMKKAANEVQQQKLVVDSLEGFLSPGDTYKRRKEDISRKQKTDEDNLIYGSDSDYAANKQEIEADAAKKQYSLDLLELNRLNVIYQQQMVTQRNKEVEQMKEICKLQKEITAGNGDKDALKKKLEEANKAYQDLKDNGLERTHDFEKAYDEQAQKAAESAKKVKDTQGRMSKESADFLNDEFSQLLIKGKSLQDVLKNILQEIAQLAMKSMIYKMVGRDPSEAIRGNKVWQAGSEMARLMNGRKQSGISMLGGGETAMSRMTSFNPDSFKTMFNKSFSMLQKPMYNLSNVINKMYNPVSMLPSLTAASKEAFALNTTKTVADTVTRVTASATNTAGLTANTAGLATLTAAIGTSAALPYKLAASGGFIQGFASGGDTGGLISGPGSGVSDSILTYLSGANRMIKTSNGEFIINAHATKTLGVDFLDVLNKHPDLLAGAKRYADGGYLGDELSPSMSATTASSYRSFTASSVAKSSNPNKKMEQLLAKQTDVIKNMGTNDNGKVVVVQANASSAQIIKILQQNPRALKAITGRQEHYGFR